MIQDTTKITIEFVVPIDNSDRIVKITTNEYGQELTNETTVKAVIWEAYKNSLINNVCYPVKGFENDTKAALTVNELIDEQVNKLNELSKFSYYNIYIAEKLQNIFANVNNCLNLETLSTTYNQLVILEKEIRTKNQD
jgi:hypothetical protein